MKKIIVFTGVLFLLISGHSQNTSPFWSLAGNNNATATSKLGSTNSIPLKLFTGNTEKMRINVSGNVGIGVTNPLTKLHVNGSGSFGRNATTANATRVLNLVDANAVMRILRVDPTNAPAVELLSRTTADGPNVSYWDLYTEPTDASFRIRDRRTGARIDRLTIGNTGDFTLNNNQFFLRQIDGRIGIGTTNPFGQLDVVTTSEVPAISARVLTDGDFGTPIEAQGGDYGVYATAFNRGGAGIGVYGRGGYVGLQGRVTGGLAGVQGISDDLYGVQGTSTEGIGVQGMTTNGTGVEGITREGIGVAGSAEGSVASTGFLKGIYGDASNGSYCYGVYGTASGGTTFTAAGYFNGNVWATGYNYITSDRKFKTDITPVKGGSLQKLIKLKLNAYTFKTDEFSSMHFPEGNQIGLIADEVKQVFPEMVKQGVFPAEYNKDKSVKNPEVKYEGVNYIGLIPSLIGSIQEQQQQIREQQKQIDRLEEMVSQLAGQKNITTNLNGITLDQNNPNPFNKNTSIQFNIPTGVNSASLVIADITGKVIKQIKLNPSSTKQKLNLEAAGLVNGQYVYSIIINGKVMQTKKMIVAKGEE